MEKFLIILRPLKENLRFFRARPWLILICITVFLMASGMGMTNPVLSLYARSFGISTSLVGVYITIFALGRILATIPTGFAADRWGRRITFILGPLISAVAAFGQATAQSYIPLLIFRALQGIGSALAMSSAFLVVADLSKREDRGRTTSFFHASLLTGLTIAPAIGGVLADRFGLQAPFYASAGMAIIIGLFIWLNLPESIKTRRNDQDISPNNQEVGEKEHQSTLQTLFSDSNFVLIALVGFIIFVARAGARDTIMPLIGADVIGLQADELGFIFTSIAGLNLIAVPISGVISDRWGRKPAIFLGLLMNGFALWLVATASAYGIFYLGIALMGFGKGFAEPSSVVYVTDISPLGKYGSSYGLYLTLRDMGLLLGPIIMGRLADVAGLQFPLYANGIAMIGIGVLFVVAARETLLTKNQLPESS